MSETQVYEPYIRAILGTAAHSYKAAVLKLKSVPLVEGGPRGGRTGQEGRWEPTWERGFKLPWREAGPPNYHDDEVNSDQ